MEQLRDHAAGAGTTLWQAACDGVVGGKPGSAIAQFVLLIERRVRRPRRYRCREAVAHVIEHSGLAAHYGNEKEGRIGSRT